MDTTESNNENKEEKTESEKAEDENSNLNSFSFFTHRLEISDEIKQKVLDANVADNDRWNIYDPRNPLNKRKLEESRDIMRKKKDIGYHSNDNYRSQRR
jgi:peptidyl-prolyl cis-trans isomerase SDCCAG10